MEALRTQLQNITKIINMFYFILCYRTKENRVNRGKTELASKTINNSLSVSVIGFFLESKTELYKKIEREEVPMKSMMRRPSE